MKMLKTAACILAILAAAPADAVPTGTSINSGSLPVTGAIVAATATTTTGQNTFTVDSVTAAEIAVGMSVISTAFPSGSYVSAVAGTTVTVAILNGTGNATSTGSAAVQFGINRVTSPYFGARTIMGTQAYFGSAATGNTTWNWKFVTSPDYPGNASVVSLNDFGTPAGYFGAHTAPLASANNASTYAVFLNAINDNPTYANSIWGFYVQCEQAPGAAQAQTFCAEISPVNFGAAGSPADPYTNNGVKNVETLRLDAGNGAAGLSEGTDIIHMLPNGTKVLHAIDISATLLDMTADPHAPALALPQNVAVTWYGAAGQKGWQIYDSTSTNVQNSLIFSPTAMTSSQPISLPGGSAAGPAVSIGSPQVGMFNNGGYTLELEVGGAEAAAYSTTNAYLPFGVILHERGVSCSGGTVAVANTDYSVEITALPASGSCAVSLPSVGTPGYQFRVLDASGGAATHNIVITPASGNIDGSATYTISTNWGSWTGEYTGSLMKTVAKL